MKHSPGDEPGQGLVEYALLLVLVTVVVIITLVLLGPSLGDFVAGIISLFTGQFDYFNTPLQSSSAAGASLRRLIA